VNKAQATGQQGAACKFPSRKLTVQLAQACMLLPNVSKQSAMLLGALLRQQPATMPVGMPHIYGNNCYCNAACMKIRLLSRS
jgi:hypothetical protein